MYGSTRWPISWAITYREDWFKEEGLKYPETWDEFRAAGRKLKAKGKPFGQAFGHSINDPNNWCYPLVWMWGGMEVEKDGKTVALDGKATIEAIRFNNVLWKEVFDEGGLAWDDSNNNRAFLAGDIACTLNGASIYIVAKRQKDKIKDDKGEPLFQDIEHAALLPKGPAGQFALYVPFQHAIMKYSKNQKLAKDFLKFLFQKENYDAWIVASNAFNHPPLKNLADHPIWARNPKFAPEEIERQRQQMLSAPVPDTAHPLPLTTAYPPMMPVEPLFVVVVIAGLMILAKLGLDIGPAVAGLGVVGIAVGFGAQTLVRDYLTGALILVAAATTSSSGITRLAYSLAEHGGLPREFARLERRALVSSEVILIAAALGIALIVVTEVAADGDPSFLAAIYSFGVLIAFTAAQLAVIRLRMRAPELAHLVRDHRPRHDRQEDEAEENELHDEARLEYQVEYTEAHETSPIAVPTTNPVPFPAALWQQLRHILDGKG